MKSPLRSEQHGKVNVFKLLGFALISAASGLVGDRFFGWRGWFLTGAPAGVVFAIVVVLAVKDVRRRIK
jgi:MFS family permease